MINAFYKSRWFNQQKSILNVDLSCNNKFVVSFNSNEIKYSNLLFQVIINRLNGGFSIEHNGEITRGNINCKVKIFSITTYLIETERVKYIVSDKYVGLFRRDWNVSRIENNITNELGEIQFNLIPFRINTFKSRIDNLNDEIYVSLMIALEWVNHIDQEATP